MSDKIIEYNVNFHLGYNDGSREAVVKFLNDEQIKHNGQIINILADKITNEEYILKSITFKSVNQIKKIYVITGTLRRNIPLVFIVDFWYACFDK
jgi:hypothetical protein